MIPQKTRATFQSRVRFLSVYPRKGALLAGIWLRVPKVSPRFRKIEHLGSRNFVHEVLLAGPGEVDAELIGWVREARNAGLAAPPRTAKAPS